MVCGKEHSGRNGPSLVVKNYWIWSGASYLCCDDIRPNEREYIYNKNFNLYIAFNYYYLDTSMEIEDKIGIEKISFWTFLTLIVLYFVSKDGSEHKRLLGYSLVFGFIVPKVAGFLTLIFFLSLL